MAAIQTSSNSDPDRLSDRLSVEPVDHVSKGHLDLTCSRLAQTLK